ncbi:MAG: hypothetical protein GWN16_05250 [Calditrichae bacterium]|nr:hypothetical protein [Calditrichia bacterium]NIW78891.1 hypothetical protein [Calditrichia bacterium]
MSLEQRYLFLDKLFHDHEKYFEAFLNGLNNIATWKEASAILDKLYMQQEVDPYSHVALEFSDLVYNRYFPKDKAHYTGVKFKA